MGRWSAFMHSLGIYPQVINPKEENLPPSYKEVCIVSYIKENAIRNLHAPWQGMYRRIN